MSSNSSDKRQRLSPEALRERQDIAYNRHLLGTSTATLAEEWGITDRQVRKYIVEARSRFKAELRRTEGMAGVERQFAALNYVLVESISAFEKSKQKKVISSKSIKKKSGGENGGTEQTVASREEERIGDVVFLGKILEASREIRSLIGLDAPTVKQLLLAGMSEVPGINDPNDDISSLSAAELLRRYRVEVKGGEGLE